MKLLIVSLFLPQEKAYHAGGRYVFEVIRALSRRHEIHLALRLEEGEFPLLQELAPYCREIHPYSYPALTRRNLAGNAKLVLNYLGFSRFADRLIHTNGYDAVMVEWVEAAILIRKGQTPLILDAHDVISKPAERSLAQSRGAARLWAGLKYWLVRSAETRIARRCSIVFTRSDFDRQFLLSLTPGLKVKTVPHPAGLDITPEPGTPRPNTILFLASFKHRRLNVDAALYFYREVFPLVRREIPEARFIMAGYGPPEELTRIPLADPQVEVPGFVDDLDRCYKDAAVFVAPILTGGGIIVKVLDALAAGRPVVSTSYGNEGIGAEPGREILIADDAAEFARAIVKLLREPAFAAELAENGRRFVQRTYGLESVLERIESSFREVAGR